MNIREIRQEEAVQAFMGSDRRTIVNACPRFGKIKVALTIIEKLQARHVWIFAPRNDIFKGWNDDMKKFDAIPVFPVGQTTFTSIKKIGPNYLADFVIIDEPHEMSVNQQVMLAEKLKYYHGPILGLTGTMTNKTREELYDNLTLDTCYQYTIEEGVEDGILTDYQLIIHQIPLEKMESQKFSRFKYAKEKAKDTLAKHFISLKMINLIQNSKAKAQKTRELIEQFKGERILVFCGVTEVADNLGIPAYHSKAREKELFNNFCSGIGDTLATIKMMQAGITVTPINRGIVNYMSGNPEDSAQKICRFLGFEYASPDKKAEVHIISSNEDFEIGRLKTGLAFFDQSKIKIIKI